MQNLYLMPAEQQNLHQSIVASVPLEKIATELIPADAQLLRNQFADQRVHCWACSSDNSHFKNMHEGDVVLFRVNGQTNFSCKGSIAFTARSKTLGRIIWPAQPTHGGWEFIFFLKA
jgi:hypothetical protein